MKRPKALLAILVAAVFAGPAAAQEYWEYEPGEGEWERHEPREGMEYEYEYYDDAIPEGEPEQYEWEPGEGYHEQEWYDPSDWFEFGRDLEYEDGNWGGGYYDDGYYDDDWFYDYYEFHYEPTYDWQYDPVTEQWRYEPVYE